jgi:hypothetical protein
MTRLIGRMIPLTGVITKITLEKTTSRDGKLYALYVFEAVSQLSPEESAAARAFGKKFVEVLDSNNADLEIVESV